MAANTVNTYDFKKVSVIVNGHHVVGFHDGSVVKAEKNEDNVIPHVGADGGVTYTESNDNTGTITITLKQNSSSLPYLINLAKQKKTFPVQVIDANDNKLKAGGSQARILRTPAVEWGAEIAGVEVQIHVADFDLK
jgi:hypothetical protein